FIQPSLPPYRVDSCFAAVDWSKISYSIRDLFTFVTRFVINMTNNHSIEEKDNGEEEKCKKDNEKEERDKKEEEEEFSWLTKGLLPFIFYFVDLGLDILCSWRLWKRQQLYLFIASTLTIVIPEFAIGVYIARRIYMDNIKNNIKRIPEANNAKGIEEGTNMINAEEIEDLNNIKRIPEANNAKEVEAGYNMINEEEIVDLRIFGFSICSAEEIKDLRIFGFSCCWIFLLVTTPLLILPYIT
ncbi:unnamed protein product, partial [Meganyctiphanes norvegica]